MGEPMNTQKPNLFKLLTICLISHLPLILIFPQNGLSQKNLVDLTHSFDEKTIYWPTSQPFKLDVVHKGPTKGGYWYEANNYLAAEHGGTHMDAPVHFAKNKWTVDQIPLSSLVAPGILVDVSKRALVNPDYLISQDDIIAWEKENGSIPSGVIVLIRTGWEKFWPDKAKYLGSDVQGDASNLHFPGFSEKAAELLVLRKVVAVGLDTASLDFGSSKEFKAHQVFGKANIPGFENLRNLDKIPSKGFRVIALPMKIGGGSGAPLRIIVEFN